MGSMALFHTLLIFSSGVVLSQALPPTDNVSRLYYALVQQQYAADHPNEAGHVRNLDSLGGGNLVRDARGMDSMAGITFGGAKRFDSMSGVTFGGHKRDITDQLPLEYQYYLRRLPQPKRNFDEIDHSGFSGFAKRNFDEIDHSGFSGFAKRNFDEIDHSSFDSFAKRSAAPPARPHVQY